MPKAIVLADYPGRLGNRLCLFIHVLAVAMEHGFEVFNFTLQAYASWFEELSQNSCCHYPAPTHGYSLHKWMRGLRSAIEWLAKLQIQMGTTGWLGIRTISVQPLKQIKMDCPAFLKVCRSHSWIILWGWPFCADSYLERHQNAIRLFLRLKRGLEPRLEEKLKQGQRDNDWQIALHIRQGDFRTWQGGKYYIPPSFFARYAWKVRDSNPGKKIQFWVCSDEPVDLTKFPPGTQASFKKTLREDLYILTSCNFILTGTSTLARAAAFLGGGRINCLIDESSPLENPTFWKTGYESLFCEHAQ